MVVDRLAVAIALITAGFAVGHAGARTLPDRAAPVPIIAAAAPITEPLAVASSEPAIAVHDKRALVCMAKVIHHEAGNQPRHGQIAVGQVLLNRVEAGFGRHVCDVANQPGQFFRLSRYKPNRRSATWAQAMDVAHSVMAGDAPDHARGALFFRAAWSRPNRFFRTRTKVVRLDDHIFYR